MPPSPKGLAASLGGWLTGGALSSVLRDQQLIQREFVGLLLWLLNSPASGVLHLATRL